MGSSPDVETAESAQPPAISGYDLVRVIGRGGMGVVWEAIEHRLARHVALKVHITSGPPSSRTGGLWTEALVAARIGDPSIVSVLDVGFTIDGRPFYTMDLVHGTDLAAVIADGPLPPRKAVAIAADMARAAAAAHQHGITHRDLKPRNVIVDASGRGRVVDFGIALDARGGEDRFAGQLAGSPPYMAPEQIGGGVVGPKADIWAIGVILYEMLTGDRPFAGDELQELFVAILHKQPSVPSGRREGIHADLDAIVMKCLSKDPSARFGSAGALFETLSAVIEGQPVAVTPAEAPAYVPRATGALRAFKPLRDEAKKHLSWSWRLASPPEALWPFVADTDHFNEAVGLAPVTFSDQVQADGVVKRTGDMRVLGMQVTWREFPFEWIREQEHSVFRWYDAGPIATLWNRVTLVPSGKGTELRHEIWASPRGVVGQVAAFVELDRRLGPAIDRVYRQLDAALVSGTSIDPFEAPHVPSSEEAALVEATCRRLVSFGFDPTIAEKLGAHLLTASSSAVRSLRPYELADRWRTDRDETLDAFIHAAQAKALEPGWDLICPTCRIAHESLARLASVKRQGMCAACATSFERDLCGSVELVFVPHPTVRKVEHATYCAGSPARRPHVIAQQVLDPGEQRSVSVALRRGSYLVAASVAKTRCEVVASAVGFEEHCEVTITTDRVVIGPTVVRAGPVRFTLHNASAIEQAVRIEVTGMRDDAVSAAAALTHPSFRSFFASELLAEGEHVRVQHLAFLFVELSARAELFESVGDAVICSETARLETLVFDAVRRHEGTPLLAPIGMQLAAFSTPLRAFRAALELQAKTTDGKPFRVPIAIAVHEGKCIALTRGGRPEFFGETLHRGQALLQECPSRGIALSPSMMADRAVAIAAHESTLSLIVDKTSEGPYKGRRVTYLVPAS